MNKLKMEWEDFTDFHDLPPQMVTDAMSIVRDEDGETVMWASDSQFDISDGELAVCIGGFRSLEESQLACERVYDAINDALRCKT